MLGVVEKGLTNVILILLCPRASNPSMTNTTAFVYNPYWGTLYVGVAWNLDGVGNRNKKIEKNKKETLWYDIGSLHWEDSFISAVFLRRIDWI